MPLLVIIQLACTKPNSYSNFLPTVPPFGGVVLCFVSIKVWQVTPCGAVKSALRLSPSFCNCLCLAILIPAHMVLGRQERLCQYSSYPTVVG